MRSNGVRVLHVQKVAGISGSEAHLLSLLPRLRERGWDVRLLMLHENEPGAWDFATALTDRGIPLDAVQISRDVDPSAFNSSGLPSSVRSATDQPLISCNTDSADGSSLPPCSE